MPRCLLSSILTICYSLIAASLGAEEQSESQLIEIPAVAPAAQVRELVASAKAGDAVLLLPGNFITSLEPPPGVSVKGSGVGRTMLAGNVILTGSKSHPVEFTDLTLIGTGAGRASVDCSGVVSIHRCLLDSKAGFATILAADHDGGTSVDVINNVVAGPQGDYAIFGRPYGADRRVSLRIVNNTIVVRGFGVGLMDGATATIRNCLFTGSVKPAVIQTSCKYDLSYCNVWLPGTATNYHAHDFLNASGERDVEKYEAPGLTFKPQTAVESPLIADFVKAAPKWAAGAGSPRKDDRNPDGSRNTLGAFGGPNGDWASRHGSGSNRFTAEQPFPARVSGFGWNWVGYCLELREIGGRERVCYAVIYGTSGVQYLNRDQARPHLENTKNTWQVLGMPIPVDDFFHNASLHQIGVRFGEQSILARIRKARLVR